MHFTIRDRVPYNKLLTNLAFSSCTVKYWPSVVFVRTSLRSVHTATTSGQYSPVRPSRSVSKRLLLKPSQLTLSIPNDSFGLSVTLRPSIFVFLNSREVYYRQTKTVLMWGLMARWLQLANHGSWLPIVKIPGCFSGIQQPHCTSLLLISNNDYSF